MGNEINKELSKKYCPRFGQIAVSLGFITMEQLKEAFVEQVEENLSNGRHRLLGEIFLEKGWMTPEQSEVVLNRILEGLMENNYKTRSSYKYCPRFGQIALELGFITKEQLKEGLAEQIDEDISHKPHRLLSEILSEKGWITNKQILIVLTELSRVEKELRDIKK